MKKQCVIKIRTTQKMNGLIVVNECTHARSNQRIWFELIIGTFSLNSTFSNNSTTSTTSTMTSHPHPHHSVQQQLPSNSTVEIFSDCPTIILRNNVSVLKQQQQQNHSSSSSSSNSFCQKAIFDNLRLIGKSGRGKKINLFIKLKAENSQTVILPYLNAIKVTVDGMRTPRQQNNKNNNNNKKKPNISNNYNTNNSTTTTDNKRSEVISSSSCSSHNVPFELSSSPSLSLSSLSQFSSSLSSSSRKSMTMSQNFMMMMTSNTRTAELSSSLECHHHHFASAYPYTYDEERIPRTVREVREEHDSVVVDYYEGFLKCKQLITECQVKWLAGSECDSLMPRLAAFLDYSSDFLSMLLIQTLSSSKQNNNNKMQT